MSMIKTVSLCKTFRGGREPVHALKNVSLTADRAAFMFEGAILETGAPRQMFADPANERTRQFLNACREKPHGLQYNQL